MSGVDGVSIAVAFVTSGVATGLVRAWALRRGKLDDVDPTRRLHTAPTPRLGGVGVATGVAVAFLVAWGRGALNEPWPDGAPRLTPAVALGCAGVLGLAFTVGLLDDVLPKRRAFTAIRKLALQAAVGVAAIGLTAGEIDGRAVEPWGALHLGGWGLPLTVAWFVAVINVANFLDGSDAILATSAVVILGALGVSAPLAAGSLLLPTAAAALGFLVWNAPPARIFMGDGGSHLLGAAIALAPCWVLDGTGSMSIPGAPWPLVGAALLPAILDVAEALIHKARHGIPMSQAHHDHLYQRLVKATGSHGVVALRYGVLALLAVVVTGPFAQRFGALAAGALGAAILAAHWIDGVRRTRDVPRLTRAEPR